MGTVVYCGQQCAEVENNQEFIQLPRHPSERSLKKVVMEDEDLFNYVPPMTCVDKFERVKYYFPFYRMELTKFIERFDKIEVCEDMNVNEMNTQFIKIEDIKKQFCVTPAWE